MANHKSAIKRNRQRQTRWLRNRQVLGTMRVAMKHAREAVDTGSATAEALVGKAISSIDKAVTKGAVKRSTASRLVGRLARRKPQANS